MEQYLYAFRTTEVWSTALKDGVPAGGESKVIDGLSNGDWGNWTPSNHGIFYIRRQEIAAATIEYLDFTTGKSSVVFTMSKPPIWGGGGLMLSPDGTTLLFAQVDQSVGNIFVRVTEDQVAGMFYPVICLAVWGRFSTCGRFPIGLFGCNRDVGPIGNRPQDEILPHKQL